MFVFDRFVGGSSSVVGRLSRSHRIALSHSHLGL